MADIGSPAKGRPRDRTVAEIEKLARQRADRRKSAEAFKRKREIEIKQNERRGMPGDVDFQRMIRQFRKHDMAAPCQHTATGPLKINVVVRKRPVSEKEVASKDFDSVSCSNPRVYVHHCKLKVDGITKVLSNINFVLDHAFHESVPTEDVYNNTAKYLVEFAAGGGRATCFAYGQTGSGKTYTMAGVQALAARDVFELIQTPEHRDKHLEVHCAFFELYGGRCVDLLHDRKVCAIREDGKGRVQTEGLREIVVSDEDELLDLIDRGNGCRTTHATEMNNDSSRSHAICQISLRRLNSREGSEPYGKLSLIDLAGSERGQDTKHHNRQRRMESAEINKSLLALKECIRALDSGSSHVPYRASKLTMVLKDSFSSDARTVMIGCISPVASSADHTLNTLRYADRVKEKIVRPAELVNGNAKRITDYSMESTGEYDFEGEDNNDLSLEEAGGNDGDDNDDEDPGQDTTTENETSRHYGSARPDDPPPRRSQRGAAGHSSRAAPSRVPAKSPGPPRRNNDSNVGNQTPQRVSRISKVPQSASKRKVWEDVGTPSKPAMLAGGSGDSSRALRSSNQLASKEPVSHKSEAPSAAGGGASRKHNNQKQNQQDLPRDLEAKQDIDGSRVASPLEMDDLIKRLVDMEEELLGSHMKAIQKNADLLTEEGVLLSKVQGSDSTDFDIGEYAYKLETILDTKLKLFNKLKETVTVFRAQLAADMDRAAVSA